MDELIDIIDESGKLSGKTCLKSEAHKKGLLHASTHIWIFNKNKEILIQKRVSSKDTFPNLWDISVAGHIAAGEKPLESALREIKEEIGLELKRDNLQFLSTFKKCVKHSESLIDNELHYIYLCEFPINLKLLQLQDEEVADVKLISFNTLKSELNKNASKYVPHGKSYYEIVINGIKKFNASI